MDQGGILTKASFHPKLTVWKIEQLRAEVVGLSPSTQSISFIILVIYGIGLTLIQIIVGQIPLQCP
jgi:hypothetical protein